MSSRHRNLDPLRRWHATIYYLIKADLALVEMFLFLLFININFVWIDIHVKISASRRLCSVK